MMGKLAAPNRLERMLSSPICMWSTLGFCFALRAVMALHTADTPLESDAALYARIAHNIASGQGFSQIPGHPTAYGNFFYPVFLAGIFGIFRDSNLAVYITQSLIDTLSCFLVYQMAKKLTGRRSTACLAAIMYAIYFPFIISATEALTETLSTFLIVLMIYILSGFAGNNKARAYVLAGVLSGILMLTRPAMIVFPYFAAGIILWTGRGNLKKPLINAAIFIAASYLIICPWTIRNYIAMHAFIPISSHGGYTLWLGTIQMNDGPFQGQFDSPILSINDHRADIPDALRTTDANIKKIGEMRQAKNKLGELKLNAYAQKEALANIKSDPLTYAKMSVPKFCRLWFHLWPGCHPTMKNYGLAIMNIVLLLLAWLGARSLSAATILARFTLILAIYLSLTSIAVLGVIRYSYPIFPFIILFAAAGIGKAFSRANNSVVDRQIEAGLVMP